MKRMQCNTSLSNVMKEPSHKAELHTQLLFGDTVILTEEKQGGWSKIKVDWDNYSGWVLQSQLSEVSDSEPNYAIVVERSCFMEVNNRLVEFFPGTFLTKSNVETLGKSMEGKYKPFDSISFNEASVRSLCSLYLDVPYMWGGNSTAGIDCSGLTQLIYRFFNMALPHFASEQIDFGHMLDFIQEARYGDLAFFINDNQEVNHVGLLLDSSTIIHASESNGRVMIDSFDQEGIINRNSGKRTHRLRAVKRITR